MALLLAKLHCLGPAQKPIDRNVKPICDLSQPVDVKRAEISVLKVDRAPAAQPNAGTELLAFIATVRLDSLTWRSAQTA
ncbi:MAG TPA: hypothetical protein VFU71_15765, partial [Burkholderiaceae bacterium]|nr:hypothetical protein [Burkholderiaceae bacterium]